MKGFVRKGYRSTSYLRGFAARRQGKYREALPFLKDALAIRKYDRVIVQEIATCYQKLGMQSELLELVREHNDVVERSASLLDFKIGTLVASGQIRDAEAAIRRLRSLGEDEGRATIRQAQILIQRDRNFEQAEKLLTNLLASKVGQVVTVRRWRAMAAAGAGHLELARQDIEFIRGRSGRQAIAQRLEVYYALANSEYERAENILAALPQSASNNLLKARILEARIADVRTPAARKRCASNASGNIAGQE